jgi:hypothetical protein
MRRQERTGRAAGQAFSPAVRSRRRADLTAQEIETVTDRREGLMKPYRCAKA